MILLRTGNVWLYLLGTFGGLAFAVWLCGKAERILNQTDPGSIVLDEITAMPLCFVVTVGVPWFQRHDLPTPTWPLIAILFILFRIFDIAKPWPIGWVDRRMHGGVGVVLDDVVAGIIGTALLYAVTLVLAH